MHVVQRLRLLAKVAESFLQSLGSACLLSPDDPKLMVFAIRPDPCHILSMPNLNGPSCESCEINRCPGLSASPWCDPNLETEQQILVHAYAGPSCKCINDPVTSLDTLQRTTDLRNGQNQYQCHLVGVCNLDLDVQEMCLM